MSKSNGIQNEKGFTDLTSAKRYLENKRHEADVHVVGPVSRVYGDLANNYPAITTFLTIFLLLSALPIVSFLGFAAFVGAILIGAATMFVLFWSAIIVGFAASILLFVLSITFFIASFTTLSVVGLFLSVRLVKNLQEADTVKAGVTAFITELKGRAIGSRASKSSVSKTSGKLDDSKTWQAVGDDLNEVGQGIKESSAEGAEKVKKEVE